MNANLLHLIRMLFNRRVTHTPIQVMRELQRRGKQRLPPPLQSEIMQKNTAGIQSLRFAYTWLRSEKITRHQGQWVINSFLPPFPGTAYDRMFTNLLSGRRLSPVSVNLAVTHECPYHCWHCSLKNRRQGHLDTNQWLDIIHQLHRLGVSIIGFTGGEPLCREDLPVLIEAASKGGATTILYTCGALTDAQWISNLKDAGLWSLCVSYDHPNSAEYDRLRGKKDALKKAEDTLRLAKQAGFYTMIGAVATREFIKNKLYRSIYQRAHALKVDEFRIVEPMPCGKLAAPQKETLLTQEMTDELRRFHRETNQKGKHPKICSFNQIESPELFGCGGGTQHLFVDPSGEITPCDFTPLSFGNVTQETLELIWKRMNQAMGNAPRRHCFIQKNHQRIAEHTDGHSFPLPPETSALICDKAGEEDLPDYFKLVTACPKTPACGEHTITP